MKHNALTFGALAALALTSACTDLESPEDGADEVALDGKADSPYSKCQLDAVVGWLNQPIAASTIIDAGVNSRAAKNLVAHRNGLDKTFGTADDNTFDTISEVDKVPYVGPTTFGQLVAAIGDACTESDPFDPASCQGPTITRAQAIARIGAGNVFAAVGATQKLMVRKRTCNVVTGCSAWGPSAPVSEEYLVADTTAETNYRVQRQDDVRLVLSVQGTDIRAGLEDASYRDHCGSVNCAPGGMTYSLDAQAIPVVPNYSWLSIYFPQYAQSELRWVRTERRIGWRNTVAMTVTNACTRYQSLDNEETEYAALVRY